MTESLPKIIAFAYYLIIQQLTTYIRHLMAESYFNNKKIVAVMSYVGKYVDEIILRNLMTLFPLTFFMRASRFKSVKQRNVTEIA